MLNGLLLLIFNRPKVTTAPGSIMFVKDSITPENVLSPGHEKKMEFIAIISIP